MVTRNPQSTAQIAGHPLHPMLIPFRWQFWSPPGKAAVLPTELVISLVVVLILLYTGWRGWEMVDQHQAVVADQRTS